ncbi:MAG TPA: STAS domain-containing protein [Thermomicrobiales bacterium]|nr:STAS domain-containing protein [Thermomicrobiales bacterium]
MEIPGFDLVTSRTDDAAVVRVIGELDFATAPQLRDVLADLTGQGTVHVTVDLSETVFIDSTGVTVLVSGLTRLHEAGGDLALESPKASAMKVFEITGLTSVFTIRTEAASDPAANRDHDVLSEDTLNA